MTGEENLRAKMPADIDAPDKVVYGLTFRQLAIFAVAGAVLAGAWHLLHDIVAMPVLVGGGGLLAVLTFAVAVSRRDGVTFDRWLGHALRYSRTPRARTTTDTTTTVPGWVQTPESRVMIPAPLRLPATAIGDDGEISLGASTAAIVAATTVNLALRTGDEQAALIDTFGRWLNSLTTPTQIVVSAQPVDLHQHADILAARAKRLPHPALADACADHAEFLADLATRRDPLRRQVLIAGRVPNGGGEHAAKRRADDTVRGLSGLGVTIRTLDGTAATAALAGCADPYRPPRPGGLAPPDAVITATTPKETP